MQNRSGAAWYIGAGDRYTFDESMPNSTWHMPVTPVTRSSSAWCVNAGSTPFGRPVVPDEYSMSVPAMRPSSGSAVCAATAASYDS